MFLGNALPGQGNDHHGDDDQAAADAQEAGQDAGDGADAHIHQNYCQHVNFPLTDEDLILSDLPPSPLFLKGETKIKTITLSNWASNNFFTAKGKKVFSYLSP